MRPGTDIGGVCILGKHNQKFTGADFCRLRIRVGEKLNIAVCIIFAHGVG